MLTRTEVLDCLGSVVWGDNDSGARLLEHFAEQRKELKDALERVADYRDDARRVLADECAKDEVHCACVPHLRKRIEELEGGLQTSERQQTPIETMYHFLSGMRSQPENYLDGNVYFDWRSKRFKYVGAFGHGGETVFIIEPIEGDKEPNDG